MIIQQDLKFKENLSHLISEIEWSKNWKNQVQLFKKKDETRNCAINLENIYSNTEKEAYSIRSFLEYALKNARKNFRKTKDYIAIAEQLAEKIKLKIPKGITERIFKISEIEKKFNQIKNNKNCEIRDGIKTFIEGASEMEQLGLEKCAKIYKNIARSYLLKDSWWKLAKFWKNPALYLNQN
tara:strand:- start:5334 stop:5879 length:546 start_codon:yes stop_codon:yes gene_type:complete